MSWPVLDQMAFFPPGHELKLEIPEVLKKVVLKRCRDNVSDFVEVCMDATGQKLQPYQRHYIKMFETQHERDYPQR